MTDLGSSITKWWKLFGLGSWCRELANDDVLLDAHGL